MRASVKGNKLPDKSVFFFRLIYSKRHKLVSLGTRLIFKHLSSQHAKLLDMLTSKILKPKLYSCRTALLPSLGSALFQLCLHTGAVSLPPLGHKSMNTAIPLCPISWLSLYQHKDPIPMLSFFTRKRNELQAPSCHCKCIDTRSCRWS